MRQRKKQNCTRPTKICYSARKVGGKIRDMTIYYSYEIFVLSVLTGANRGVSDFLPARLNLNEFVSCGHFYLTTGGVKRLGRVDYHIVIVALKS